MDGRRFVDKELTPVSDRSFNLGGLAWVLAAGLFLGTSDRSGDILSGPNPAHPNPAHPNPVPLQDADRLDHEFANLIQPFLQTHCFACHSGQATEGNFRVDGLTGNIESLTDRGRWEEIVQVLNGHQMPPESETQPAAGQVAAVVDWITVRLAAYQAAQTESSIVLRRLNRHQYRNTLRDLLGIDVNVDGFPQDSPAAGFDNNGQALTLSPLLLELYFDTAEKAIQQAIVTGDQPPVLRWRFEVEGGNDDSHRVEYDGQRVIVNGGQNRSQGDYKVLHHDHWDRNISIRDFQLPHAGKYIVRIHAAGNIPSRQAVVDSAEPFLATRRAEDNRQRPQHEAHHQQAYDETLEHFRSDPMYNYGPPRLKLTQVLGGQPKVITEMDIPANVDAPQVYEVSVDFTTQNAGLEIKYAYSLPRELENFWFQTSDDFARPELWIDWVELEGPIHPQWPPESHRRLLQSEQVVPTFDSPEQQRLHAEKVLRRLMQRAFRRPVAAAELQPYLQWFDESVRDSDAFAQALARPLAAVLVSPHFLFLQETSEGLGAETQGGPAAALNDFQLACRLSYFLWSSMPDDRLFALAAQKKLSQPDILAKEIDRMLADPKAEALVTHFAGQWLGLTEVGANPPATDLFPRYDRHLEQSIVGESHSFFRYLLQHDLNVMNFIASDFVVINQRLARYYGIPDVDGDHFRPVPVTAQQHRGGVLTQASILSITSNGTRTSPVKRGTWVLKNLFGMDPGLPLANAGDIAPQVPGIDKATVRQRLEVHRTLPQCARCHNKIDPLGLALENFNAAGAWREQEGFGYKGRINPDDPKIDARATMVDGTEFVGIAGLQQVLLGQKELFLKCLITKLATYGLGREITVSDSQQVAAWLEQWQNGDLTLRRLIHVLVLSEPFQSK